MLPRHACSLRNSFRSHASCAIFQQSTLLHQCLNQYPGLFRPAWLRFGNLALLRSGSYLVYADGQCFRYGPRRDQTSRTIIITDSRYLSISPDSLAAGKRPYWALSRYFTKTTIDYVENNTCADLQRPGFPDLGNSL